MTRRIPCAAALFALLVFLCSSAAAQVTRISEFPFAVGAGGSAVNDTDRPADVKSFSTGGFHAFFELALEPGVLLQMRYENFQLPGTPETPPFQTPGSAPRVHVDAGNITVAYVFREEWWEAGLFAGGGVYRVMPRSPEAGQTSVDVRETAFGWNGGVLVVFQLARRWDLRVEAAGYLVRSHDSKELVRLGGSVAYHF